MYFLRNLLIAVPNTFLNPGRVRPGARVEVGAGAKAGAGAEAGAGAGFFCVSICNLNST